MLLSEMYVNDITGCALGDWFLSLNMVSASSIPGALRSGLLLHVYLPSMEMSKDRDNFCLFSTAPRTWNTVGAQQMFSE